MNVDMYLDIMEHNKGKLHDALTDFNIAVNRKDVELIIRYAQKLADVANDVADDAVTSLQDDDMWEAGA